VIVVSDRWRGCSAGVALAVVAGALAVAAAARTPATADLAESKVSITQYTVRQGDRLRVFDTLVNRGSRPVGPSTTWIFLGRRRTHALHDLRLGGRRVGRLLPGSASHGSTLVRIPRSAPVGPFHIIVCADARHRVRETSEANNCRATHAIRVLAAGDQTPPTFAGLKAATTCIPGPVQQETTSYRLTWDAAADDRTPTTEIVYEIYQATRSGGEDFSSPTYTTEAGATTFATPKLSGTQAFYFVVRARDSAGNSDNNRIELRGTNACA
jgi:hypothetical protein